MRHGIVSKRTTGIVVICCITALLTFAARHFELDDALIYARYVRNALNGQGLVFNAGERVNALTSPLLAVLLLATSWLMHGNVLLAEITLSAAFLAGACILAEEIAPWSGVLIASTGYFYMCFGMETMLFLFLIMLTYSLYRKGRLDLVPSAALLTFLTRFEGGLLGAIIAYDLWRNRRLPRPRAFLLPAILVAAYLAFNFHFYGKLLPASAAAKFGQGFSGLWGRWPRAFLHVELLVRIFRHTIYVIPVAFLLGILGVRSQRNTQMNRILLPFLGGLLAFYVLLNIPNYHWYNAPFIFFLLIYAVIGLPQTKLAHILLACVIVQCTVAGILDLRQQGANPNYVALARWVDAHSSPGAMIAAVEIGTIGWHSSRNVDDILGLTNPKNAGQLRKHDFYSWLEQDKPDFVVIHTPVAFGEVAATTSPLYAYEPVHFGTIYLMYRKQVPLQQSKIEQPR
jgi:arabinofuranosyltransferase